MPGLMALREEFGPTQPLKGARIMGSSAHDHPDRGAHRDPGRARRPGALGQLQHLLHPGRRGGRRRGRPDEQPWMHRPVSRCSPGRARRSRSTGGAPSRRSTGAPKASDGPNMILDDGGDATLLVHKGREFELGGRRAGRQADRQPRVEGHPRRCCAAPLEQEPGKWTKIAEGIQGVTEETTTGVHRLYDLAKAGSCSSRRSTSTTRSPSRSSTTSTASAALAARRPEPGHRRADRRQGRVRRRLRRRRQGLRPRHCAARAPACWSAEIDPICALQAAMDGYEVTTLERRARPRRTSS